jgi:hypothetical protein
LLQKTGELPPIPRAAKSNYWERKSRRPAFTITRQQYRAQGGSRSNASRRRLVRISAWSPNILRFFMILLRSPEKFPDTVLNEAIPSSFQSLFHFIIHNRLLLWRTAGWINDRDIK